MERIISDSGLPALIADQRSVCMEIPYTFADVRGHLVEADLLEEVVVPRWQASITRLAGELETAARGIAGNASSPARLLGGLLSTPAIVKNVARLDRPALLSIAQEALDAGGPLRFEIAWGQVKRDVAGLKTAGPHADLAEASAIGRLAAFTLAAKALTGRRVELTVLSGARRFQDALLTRPEQLSLYDTERQQIADLLGYGGTLRFRDYVRVQSDRGRDPAAWQATYRDEIRTCDPATARAHLNQMALNTDWDHVHALGMKDRLIHGSRLPQQVSGWLGSSAATTGSRLTRAAVTCLINPSLRPAWLSELAGHGCTSQLLDEAIGFYLRTSWQAARRYAAVHAADRRIGEAGAPPGTIRLTVHEKRNRPDIPALAILGRRYPGMLPQHLAVLLAADGSTRMASIAELWPHLRHALPVHAGESLLTQAFGWLFTAGQPFCFAAPETDWQQGIAGMLTEAVK